MEVSRDAFDELDAMVDPVRRDEWRKQEELALGRRDVDPSSMDIFETKVKKGKSSKILFP